MAIHDFNQQKELFVTIDKVPDFRSEVEKQLTPLSIYNHHKSDIALAERWSEEIINVSGAWISLHLKMPKPPDADEVWDEDADPVYDNPKDFKAWFKPEHTMFELTRWGLDVALPITVVFSRAVLMKEIGERLIQVGDVIEAPYNIPSLPENPSGPKYFRALNVKNTGNFMYRWLYIECHCELITGDRALRPLLKGINGLPQV